MVHKVGINLPSHTLTSAEGFVNAIATPGLRHNFMTWADPQSTPKTVLRQLATTFVPTQLPDV